MKYEDLEGVVVLEQEGEDGIVITYHSHTFYAYRKKGLRLKHEGVQEKKDPNLPQPITSAKTEAELWEKIEKVGKVSRVKISVPFTQVSGLFVHDLKQGGDFIVDGEITGKHGGTGNWLVRRWDLREKKIKTGQEYGYSLKDQDRLKVLTPEEREELKQLQAARREAVGNLQAFLMAHAYQDIREVAEKAWKEAEAK